ncbi:MAG TPA: MBL fold metallo-hydrolase [Firmicutes bacterium]|nr:MBL fold metallo-hydrolase [Bacillota bacterium]
MMSKIIERMIVRRMKKSKLVLTDGLHAVLIGTGSPLADINRSGPATAVIAGKKLFLVDAGDGSARNLQATGLNIGRLDKVFLTHFHSDHIGGLGDIMMLRWAAGGRREPLPVYGPPGTAAVVFGFNEAYSQDKAYRIAHHGEATLPREGAGGMPMEFDLGADPSAAKVIFQDEDVQITAFNVNHLPVYPAVGYRFDYKGRGIVISGDTAYTDNLAKQAGGADILICDALRPELVDIINRHADLTQSVTARKITADIKSFHLTPEEAAQIAAEAGISALFLTHIVPPLPATRLMRKVFLGKAPDYFTKNIYLGQDGMLISLAAADKSILVKNLLK